MKPQFVVVLICILLGLSSVSAAPLGTAFTYQGHLAEGNQPANGLYDLWFKLYDEASGGAVIAGPITNSAVRVTNGVFTTTLDFGAIFDGTALWLAIQVRTNGAATFTPLAPRQPLTPAPYSLYAPNSRAAATAGTASLAYTVADNAVTRAGIASGEVVKSLNSLRDDVTLAAGDNLTLTPSGQTLTLGSPTDWHASGNASTLAGTDFVGTIDDQPLVLKVNSQPALRLEPTTTGAPNVIGGHALNRVAAGISSATIGGGGGAAAPHFVGAEGGTVGGGEENAALGMLATVAGGQANVAGGAGSAVGGGLANAITNASFATVAGGQLNVIVDGGFGAIGGGSQNRVTSTVATVGGGNQNLAGGLGATVAGGEFNRATGERSTVPGGAGNRANGRYSLAAGRRANADHEGAFVWADSTEADFASTGANQFLIRAGGGVGIGVANPTAALAVAGTVKAKQLNVGTGHTLDGPWSSIGGGSNNVISPEYAVIAGGLDNSIQHDAIGSFVGGGCGNSIEMDAYYSLVSGGFSNSIRAYAGYSFLGAGNNNAIQWGADHCFLGGGVANSIQTYASYSFLGGGSQNTNGGAYSVVPGGHLNFAGGEYSFAAGRLAKAHGAGSFVWGDSMPFELHAWRDNEFVVRATGGYWLFSAVDSNGFPTAGATLAAGSGSWGSWSDRNAKANVAPVDTRAVLQEVAALPITTWNYKTQDPSIRHIGPMAQDFHAAFEVGEGDQTITGVDADGVALAAIQGLNQKLEEKNAALEKEVADLRTLVRTLAEKVTELAQRGGE